MKVYLITDKDIQVLLDKLQRDPRFGPPNVGVSETSERQAYQDAHRFYNYHVHVWLDEVVRGEQKL